MTRRIAGIAVAALLAAACATVRPVSPSEADTVRAAWETARHSAYAPRRVKAMWKGEISPSAGAVARGYLLVWWDGRTLTWKASAPLAGGVRSGKMSLDDEHGSVPLPGRLRPVDAIGVLLGVLDVPAAGRPVERIGSSYRIFLDGYGRAATLDPALSVIGLELSGPTRVSFTPGAGVPHGIRASSPDGHVRLTLETLSPWPEGEPIPAG